MADRATVSAAPGGTDSGYVHGYRRLGLGLLQGRRRTTAQIVGADFCREMLAIGREKGYPARQPARCSFVEADAQQIPSDDNRFDIVSVAFGLRNVADTDRGLRGNGACLRFGGQGCRAGVFDAHVATLQGHLWLVFSERLAANRATARAKFPCCLRLSADSVGEFLQGEALAERMRQAGLVDVGYRGLTLGVATLYVGTKP